MTIDLYHKIEIIMRKWRLINNNKKENGNLCDFPLVIVQGDVSNREIYIVIKCKYLF